MDMCDDVVEVVPAVISDEYCVCPDQGFWFWPPWLCCTLLMMIVSLPVVQVAKWASAKGHINDTKKKLRGLKCEKIDLNSELEYMIRKRPSRELLARPIALKNAALKELKDWVCCAENSRVCDGLGNRVGSYSYWNPADGKVHRTDYVADSLGFRVAANDLPEGPAPVSDTPEVVAAREAHLALHRSRRSVLLQTPAATAPLATPLIARPLVAAPLIAAPLAPAPVVGAPIPLSAIPAGIPATLTTIVNNPGHAVSYRVD